MNNIFLSLVVLIMSFNMFSISYQINGINRVVIHTPLSYFEISIPLVNTNNLYFDKVKLETNLTEYYSKNLGKYSSNYNIDFYYYNLEDASICLGSNCQGVEVTITAKLLFDYSYARTMFYEIEER